MDKELTIAQMEGRFSMVVIEDVGHSIQEDNPARVTEVLKEFITKFHIP
jgi:protein phosphatase methylesterase 1